MKSRLLALAVVVVTLVCFTARPAAAQNGCGYGCGYGGYGLGYLYDSLGYNVPYFAAFPPVYYSYPVPRTYGYSPFAYPPGVMTPEVAQEVKSVQIVNPYVPKAEKQHEPERDRSVKGQSQPKPLLVMNPYFKPTRTVAHSAL